MWMLRFLKGAQWEAGTVQEQEEEEVLYRMG